MNISNPEIGNSLNTSTFDKLGRLGSCEDCWFVKEDISNLVASNSEIIQSKISGCQLQDSIWSGSKWRDVIIESSNLSTTKMSDNIIGRVQFDSCRLQGVNFGASELIDVTFINCNLDLSNLRMAKLRRVRFDNCSMTDADFLSAKLREV